ncbi:MAG: hypothetical protein ABI947_22390 [Chloroflexota bacterium]
MISMRILDTTVKVKLTFVPVVLVVWGVVTWLGLYWHPGRGFWQGLGIGFMAALLLFVAEVGHAFAHIFSARYAKAPMDEIYLAADMPRTLYWNNEVSPDQHRLRAVGGPLFNTLGFFLSLAIYAVAPGNSILRELATWSAFGHGYLMIASLIPVPIFDGGTLLKWTLVARGTTETESDKIIRKIDWVMGTIGLIIGVALIAMQSWLAGVIALAIGGAILGIASGRIR